MGVTEIEEEILEGTVSTGTLLRCIKHFYAAKEEFFDKPDSINPCGEITLASLEPLHVAQVVLVVGYNKNINFMPCEYYVKVFVLDQCVIRYIPVDHLENLMETISDDDRDSSG